MAAIWLALLLVATLGSVDPAASAISVASIKTAWETFKPTSVPADITTCDESPTSCDSAQVDPDAGGVDVDTLCAKVGTYSTCAGGCTLTETKKQELEAVEDLCKTADLEKAVADITGGNCDTATCPATAIDSASGLNAKCVEFYTYSSCAKGKCSSTLTDAQKQALQDMEDQCKTAELETALGVIKVKCPQCDTEAGAVDTASELDGKCQASDAYLTCLTDKTCTTTVPEDDKEALKTPCKATSTGTETITATAAPTVDPFLVVRSMWATFKNDQNIATNCVDKTCPSTAVENALTKDLDAFCKAIGIYSVCAKANCTSTLTDTQLLDQMNDQCKTASTLGGDDDGCSILQVSTLALMLSLLLSII